MLVYPDRFRVRDTGAALDAARILCSFVPLHASATTVPVAGLRLGTSSVARRGMGPAEMEILARLMARLLRHGDDPHAIGKEVRELRAGFTTVRFAF